MTVNSTMTDESETLQEMRGLGPMSEQQLMSIGIETPGQLKELGPVKAYAMLMEKALIGQSDKPSINFLYALVGAVEDRDWRDVAMKDKSRLLAEMDGYQSLRELFRPKS